MAQRDALQAQLERTQADREAMSREFQRLSGEAMQRQTLAVNQTAGERLAETKLLMEPVAKSLHEMNDRLLQVERPVPRAPPTWPSRWPACATAMRRCAARPRRS